MGNLRRVRLAALGLGFLCAAVAVGFRLATVQIGQHTKYLAGVLRQDAITVPLEDVPRGLILDRNHIPLTGSHREDRVLVVPALMQNRRAVEEGLARVLGVPPSDIARRLNAPGYLPFRVTREQKRSIERASWPGVTVAPVALRYGARPLAVHVVGHLGMPDSPAEIAGLRASSRKAYGGTDLVGKTGIEKYYETRLKGVAPRIVAAACTDATGRPLKGWGIQVAQVPDRERQDVVLTIDARVQQVVEDVMDQHRVKGAVVVEDVASGDILAMAARPAYHPAQVERYLAAPDGPFTNRAITPYFPGSLFKIVVAAAALEKGVVSENGRFLCRGQRDPLVHCWLPGGHGSITFGEAFAVSCNPVFARIALRLGSDQLIDYARRLGLENQAITGFPHPPDPRPDLDAIKERYNLVNAAIGQWPVLLTPVQVCTMVATVARGGIYRQPRLVQYCMQDGRILKEEPPAAPHQAISTATAKRLQDLMALVTTTGQGRAACVPAWGAAGKTGTAEIGDGQKLAWFAGYVPVEHPRLAITVLVEGGVSGGQTAAPVFREIAARVLGSK